MPPWIRHCQCYVKYLATRWAAWFIISVDSVCLSVSLSDDGFRKSWQTKLYLHIWYISRQCGSCSYVKVIGSRSRSQEPKTSKTLLFPQCLLRSPITPVIVYWSVEHGLHVHKSTIAAQQCYKTLTVACLNIKTWNNQLKWSVFTFQMLLCMFFCTYHVFSSFLLCCNASAFVICAIKNYLLTYLNYLQLSRRVVHIARREWADHVWSENNTAWSSNYSKQSTSAAYSCTLCFVYCAIQYTNLHTISPPAIKIVQWVFIQGQECVRLKSDKHIYNVSHIAVSNCHLLP